MKRRRYLIQPPRGFCAPFVVWAESKALARRYAAQWLGINLPPSTVILKFVDHDKLTAMLTPARRTRAPAQSTFAAL